MTLPSNDSLNSVHSMIVSSDVHFEASLLYVLFVITDIVLSVGCSNCGWFRVFEAAIAVNSIEMFAVFPPAVQLSETLLSFMHRECEGA